jgi:hypothetical protein
VNGLQSKWTLIFNKHRSKTRLERYEAAAIDEPNQSRLTCSGPRSRHAERAHRTRNSRRQWKIKGTVLSNEEARVAFRYHFSLKLMEKLPAKCLCGHKVGDVVYSTQCRVHVRSHALLCAQIVLNVVFATHAASRISNRSSAPSALQPAESSRPSHV